jgi:hypothetical protein
MELREMSFRRKTIGTAALALTGALFAFPASAVPVLCEDTSRNHMYIDSAYVSSCVDAGVGNVNGNPATDSFLLANPELDYTGIGSASYLQIGSFGNFWFDSDLWDDWNSIALGFKFGTGGSSRPDQWFVYELDQSVSNGWWNFVNVFNRGGGLSHIQIYGVGGRVSVPEPGALGLLGLGLVGLALARRRKVSNV